MGNIDKWIKTVEKYIAGMDDIGLLKIDKAVPVGMGMGHMGDTDTVIVQVETDIL